MTGRAVDLLLRAITFGGGWLAWGVTGMRDPPWYFAAPWLVLEACDALTMGIRGTTIGKRRVKVRVVRPDGARAGLLQVLFREWIGVPATVAVGVGLIALHRLGYRRRLHLPFDFFEVLPHDWLAGTRVVDDR